jgi:hypothetical protein
MIGSMGQVGSASDNAAMESFFALLQRNVLDRRRWATPDELRTAVLDYIEAFSNPERIQQHLGHHSPPTRRRSSPSLETPCPRNRGKTTREGGGVGQLENARVNSASVGAPVWVKQRT